MAISPNTGTKRPLGGPRIGLSEIHLSEHFPLRVVTDGIRDDQPITMLHWHNALEIGYCVEGTGTFYVADKILPFQAGDMTVITDAEYHRCQSSPGTASRWVWFFLDPIRLLVPHAMRSDGWKPNRFRGSQFENVIHAKHDPVLADYIRLLVMEGRREDCSSEQNLRSLVQLFLTQLNRSFPETEKSRSETSSTHPICHSTLNRIAPALELIAHHFDQPLTVADLAESCGLSLRTFQKLFSKQMNRSPKDYLQHSRVQAAAALLCQHDRSITEICFACGFSSLSAFNRTFKKVHGVSPREYSRR